MTALLEDVLGRLTAGSVTEVFFWLILGIFVVAIVFRKRWRGFVAYTPNLLTSMGILGTFVGIVIGLMGFDPADIDKSIPLLLEGLKTAFVTSLVGMGLSIVFKGVSTTPWFTRGRVISGSKDIGPALLKGMDEQNRHLEALRTAIAGEEESSLAGQIKLFRSDANDHARETQKQLQAAMESMRSMHELAAAQREHFEMFADKLWQQMEAFAEMLSKSATEQVINALKEVIADFNKNLTEQFGENFKALDASVRRLVEWQENYRQQLEQMQEQYRQGVEAITTTEASLAHISEQSERIPVVMGQLGEVIEVNQHQIEELDRHLEAFVEVRDKATEAVPEIGRRIDEMTEGVAKGTQMLIDGVKASSEQMSQSIATSIDEFEKNTQNLSGSLHDMADHLATQSEQVKIQIGDMAAELNANIRNMAQVLVDSHKQLNEETASTVQSVQQLGQQLQKDTVEVQKHVASAIEQMQVRLQSSIEEVLNTQTQESAKALEGMKSAVEAAVERTGDGVNSQMQLIDDVMTREVERVMTEMGEALARISHQFTNDYVRLVEAMDKVVRQGGRG